jgi:hypothetical protein
MWVNLKRLMREFLLPLLVALLWAAVQIWSPHGAVPSFITNLMAALFFASWLQGHYTRIKYHQSVEVNFQGVKDDLANVSSALTSLAGSSGELLELTKNLPELQAAVTKMADATSSANTQLAQANSTVSTALSQIRGLPWAIPWELPPRLQPNPAIYGYTSGPATPLALDESTKPPCDPKS